MLYVCGLFLFFMGSFLLNVLVLGVLVWCGCYCFYWLLMFFVLCVLVMMMLVMLMYEG